MKTRSNVDLGKRNYSVLITFVGFMSVVLYPIIIRPMLYTEEYRKEQSEARKNINQEEVQPGNMRIWSDPFGRK